MRPRTYIQIALMVLAAGVATIWTAHLGTHPWLPFWFLLPAVVITADLKVVLPERDGSMSATFPFLLMGITLLSPLQCLLLAGLSVAVQCRHQLRRFFSAAQVCFNIANAVLATAFAYISFAALQRRHIAPAPSLALASVVYFGFNTTALAIVLASANGDRALKLWRSEFAWYLPFYIVGAVVAAVATWLGGQYGWPTALLLVPAVYTLHRAYTSQLARIEERQQHLDETEALHVRTIEALAMAIEAKDQNTHDHLFRVRDYVQAVGSALRLDKLQMQALQTAAFLHDIGKLAVPEHIVNKPGRLTPEEFEKMKIHPIVGADILDRVRFPYPVVPIVRSHHEWWDGSGYPDGLSGEDIPIGARVLTVVDCFDALASDRPYRKGMPPDQALAMIKSLAGKQFDPSIVTAFEMCFNHRELSVEKPSDASFTPLNTDVEIWRGLAPGAGFETGSDENAAVRRPPIREDERRGEKFRTGSLTLIAAASHEAQILFEMSQSLGNSLSPTETVSVMASRLHRLIPHDVCALFLKTGDTLQSRFIGGEQAARLNCVPILVGEGISGWVAQSGKPIFNGNAAVEPGCTFTADASPLLRAALSVPLFDLQEEVFGVLTLYSVRAEAFLRDHLRILQAMESKLSLSLTNALQFRRTETDAETDFLTGLPNARRLFLQLAAEMERCSDNNTSLAVAVCDLNAFKEVNDRRGHLTGNRLLGLISEEFRALCANHATVARMGGDEFVFMMRGVSDANAAGWQNAISDAVARASLRTTTGVKVTASLGFGFFPRDGTNAEELLALADRRMYLDKQAFYKARPPEIAQAADTGSALRTVNE